MIDGEQADGQPGQQDGGPQQRRGPAATPTGVIAIAATTMAMVSPVEPGNRCPVARLSRM